MEMPKDLTILDLIVLEKIEKDSLMESFSGKLYSSFFDTASILGTLQVKQLVSISSAIGRSVVNRSELGEKVLLYAEEKSSEPLDGLDHVILKSIAGGNKVFESVKNDLNLRSDDLAVHLYKVIKQGYADYEIRAGKLTLNITEKGFKLTGYVPKKQNAQVEQKQSAQIQPKAIEVKQTKQLDIKSVLSSADATPAEISEEGKKLGALDKFIGKLSYFVGKYAPYIIVVILLLILLALYLTGYIAF
ncbi:MAG: hypothetical protein N3G74_02485 [Candidatus Micrarchaeota archaeon]|nr:hypothetical protein [Candidatus Micrarchaeota archaeon]